MLINGQPHSLPEPTTVKGLLQDLRFDPTRVAVLLNGEIVARNRLADTPVNDRDTLEVVAFVGGG